MIDPRRLDELANTLSNLLPPGIIAIKQEFEKNAKAALQGVFERMNLVSREEFEVQAAVLLRTREKLEALELQLEKLERQLNIKT